MKKIVICIMCLMLVTINAHVVVENRLNLLELDAQKAMQGFNDLSQNMSVAQVSESIISHNAQQLEHALGDLINLNNTVNNQVNVAIQFWNMYLDSVKIPSMETYLLGQVMNSLIGTIRALSLRSSVDQAMILSLIKSNFDQDEDHNDAAAQAVDASDVTIVNRWNAMHVQ